jgi:hypothetical protein
LCASQAANQPWAGAARGVGEGGIDDLHQFPIARR